MLSNQQSSGGLPRRTPTALDKSRGQGVASIQRPLIAKMRDLVGTLDYTEGKGEDATVALNAALDDCYEYGKKLYMQSGVYAVRELVTGCGYGLRNKGVSMIGDGPTDAWYGAATFANYPADPKPRGGAIIVPTAGMASTASYLRFQPENIPNDTAHKPRISGLDISDFMIWPVVNGALKGKYGLHCYIDVLCSVWNMHVHDMQIAPGNDYSFWFECPSASSDVICLTIERNAFWEGMGLDNITDSVEIRRNLIRGTGSRIGINIVKVVSGAAHLKIDNNNIACDGGNMFMGSGRQVEFTNNNMEFPHTSGSTSVGTPNSAVVDFDGGVATIVGLVIRSNSLNIFSPGSTATEGIRINAVEQCDVDMNKLLSTNTIPKGIEITSSASNVCLGGVNEIGTHYTLPATDAGVGTMGTLRALAALLVNSFTEGSVVLYACKSKAGLVTLQGAIACPASPATKTMMTLPVGFRPAVGPLYFYCGATDGSTIYLCLLEIDTNGTFKCLSPNTMTGIILDGTVNFQAGSALINDL